MYIFYPGEVSCETVLKVHKDSENITVYSYLCLK